MRKKDKKAQTVMEMAVLILVIVAAAVAMQTYIKRGIQGRLRAGVDSIGEQYDPVATTSDFTMTHVSNTTTNTTTVTTPITVWGYDAWHQYVPTCVSTPV